MRILYIATHFPMPLHSGQAVRTQSILRALAVRHQVSFVGFIRPEQSSSAHALDAYCHAVTTVPFPARFNAKLDRLSVFFRGGCYSIERFISSQYRNTVHELLRRDRFDVIIADSLHPLVNLENTGLPVILNSHNVEWVILHRYAAMGRPSLAKWYARWEAQRVKNAERHALQRGSVAFACSADDAALLRQLHDIDVHVIPNAVDIETYASCRIKEKPHPPEILFQGSLDWFPNVDALDFFLTEIWQRVRAGFPETRFRVVGRNPSPELMAHSDPSAGIEIIGAVPDVRPYLAAATAVVVPLRVGGGTRLKIIEAAACALPIVSTSLGAEGLNFQNGRSILIADSPADFADAILTVLREPPRRQALGEHALLDSQAYGLEALGRSLENALVTLG